MKREVGVPHDRVFAQAALRLGREGRWSFSDRAVDDMAGKMAEALINVKTRTPQPRHASAGRYPASDV